MCIRLLPSFDYEFLPDFPSPMQDIAICYVQHCQAMFERGVCELAHSIIFHVLYVEGYL